jgi:hypothetical protein
MNLRAALAIRTNLSVFGFVFSALMVSPLGETAARGFERLAWSAGWILGGVSW